MKLAIMQPYFFPYLGYFSLIQYTDFFIFFDTPQYIRKGWINRNRILKANGDETYFTVPIYKAPRETPILNIKIDNRQNWKNRLLGQLSCYKNRAPYYIQTIEVVQNVLEGEWIYLSDLCIKSCIEITKYLDMDLKYNIFSKMNLKLETVYEADEWALKITKAMNYDIYVNLIGGVNFFNSDKYKKTCIGLQFLKNNLPAYKQRIGKFIPGLSILDVMMFCSPADIRQILTDCTVIIK